MGRPITDTLWQQLTQDVTAEMGLWRVAHPKATLREIEVELDTQLNRMRARMLEDLTSTSAASTWSDLPPEDHPHCPQCNHPLEVAGAKPRTLQTHGGQALTLTRQYGVCPACGAGLFPLDDELGLLPGSLPPRLAETLVRLSTTQPSFAKACTELAWLTGTSVHADTARRRSEAAGASLVAHETAEAARILHEHPDPPLGPDTLIFSVDGAMVPIVGGQFKEVRTLAVGAVQPPVAGPDGPLIHTTDLSYFSRLTASTTFAELALAELHRRGIETAGRVGAVVDGADWCQSFIDYHYSEAVRILDLPHAAEYLTAIGQTLGEGGPLLSAANLQRLRDELRDTGPERVLAELRGVVATQPANPDLRTNLAYLHKRQAQMQYPTFVAEGWPIGSGMVESANKLVVEARLKGAGMHWQEQNINPMLALRNAFCAGRWDEGWRVIEHQQRQQVIAQRHQRRMLRTPLLAPSPSSLPDAPASMAPTPRADAPVEPQAKSPHPWKRAWSVRRQRQLAGVA